MVTREKTQLDRFKGSRARTRNRRRRVPVQREAKALGDDEA